MWVYIQSEPGLWTVGFYKPDGSWYAESDWDRPSLAADRCHYLNGGSEEGSILESSHNPAFKHLQETDGE